MSEPPAASTLNQRIADRARSAIGWIRQVSLFIKVVLVTGGALVSGLAKVLPIEKDPLDLKDLIVGAGIVAAFLGGIALIFLEKSLVGSLSDAADAAAELQRVVGASNQLTLRFAEVEARDARARALRQASEQLRDLVERSFSRAPLDEIGMVAEMLDVSLGKLQSAMNLGPDDLWTISIYRAEPGPRLARVASRRADRLEEKAFSREWGAGEGHIGMTFLRRDSVVLEDVSDPAILHALNTPAPKNFADDAFRYRSIASWPIIPVGFPEPWGVAIATSALAGRFSPINPSIGRERAEAMRLLARMLALAVSAHHSISRSTAVTASSSGPK